MKLLTRPKAKYKRNPWRPLNKRKRRGYPLTARTLNAIKQMAIRFSEETNYRISDNFVLEMAIHHVKDKSFQELFAEFPKDDVEDME